ncbi:hypothetical protein DRO29_00505 [Candidatus Bathyarchaeota archaeon]|nr:MAG: hypothetical protein DRO29_00505 [Candidatus Bathyarchaeota archaeon]
MALVKIPFRVIQHNVTPNGEEIVFPYNGKWYRCDIANAPKQYFTLRKLYLWLTEGKTFDESITVDLSLESVVEIDLDVCEEIPETYPL